MVLALHVERRPGEQKEETCEHSASSAAAAASRPAGGEAAGADALDNAVLTPTASRRSGRPRNDACV
jgi:hypothetical protein